MNVPFGGASERIDAADMGCSACKTLFRFRVSARVERRG